MHDAKGGKDRVVMLPRSMAAAVRLQLLSARALCEADREAQRGGVETPHALEKEYPEVGYSRAWLRMFLSPTLSIDPRSGLEHPLPALNSPSSRCRRVVIAASRQMTRINQP